MSVTLMTETNLYKDDAIADGLEDASKVATNYLAYNAQDGLTVGRTGQSERAVIASDGMEIYDGQNDNIAEFKPITRLGYANSGNLILDYHSLQLQDIEGNTYVHLSDLRDNTGYAHITDRYYGNGTAKTFELSRSAYDVTDIESVTVSGSAVTGYTLSPTTSSQKARVTLATAPASSATVLINYKTQDAVKAYTFGKRDANFTIGSNSFTNGTNLIATGDYSHAEGRDCSSGGMYSHAEGNGCFSRAEASHAEGYACDVGTSGKYAHAEGYGTDATGECSHSEGKQSTASGESSHAEGYGCTASGQASHAEGYGCTASGTQSHAEGYDCTASGTQSHAEGYMCVASGERSHAEGYTCESSGLYAHAEGWECIARKHGCHAEGSECIAGDNYPNNTTTGRFAHAEGQGCVASGTASHAEGLHTEAAYPYQHVCGQFNVSTHTAIFIIGGGNYAENKNAMTVTTEGDVTIAGTLTQSSDKRLKLHHAYLSDQEPDVTSFVESLKPAYFEKDQAKHLGFYAQDVQLSDKWNTMVSEDTNGYLALGYTEIIAPLVAYVQNQQKKIDSLEERIARLEQLINQQ